MEPAGFFLIWLGLAVAVGVWADSKGRNGWGYWLLAVIISPLFGGIIVALRSNLIEEARAAERQRYEERVRIEEIKALAKPPAPPPIPKEPQQSALSVADELTKLADLKAKGVLNDDEFNAQKARLLRA